MVAEITLILTSLLLVLLNLRVRDWNEEQEENFNQWLARHLAARKQSAE